MKKIIIFLLIIIIFILAFIFLLLHFQKNNSEENTLEIKINNHIFILEKAITPLELEKGLMFRESMPENHGMIFMFDNEQQRSFWMKNTLISLDIIFIDENYKITSIQTAEPCVKDPCPLYSANAQYVVELNAGVAKDIGLKVKDIIQLNNF